MRWGLFWGRELSLRDSNKGENQPSSIIGNTTHSSSSKRTSFSFSHKTGQDPVGILFWSREQLHFLHTSGSTRYVAIVSPLGNFLNVLVRKRNRSLISRSDNVVRVSLSRGFSLVVEERNFTTRNFEVYSF